MMVILNIARCCFLSLLLFGTACTHAPIGSGYTDFSAYAESVFRRQNTVTSQLMMLNEAELIESNEQIDAAEEAMNQACELLNQYAEHDSDHESMGFSFKSKVQNSIEGCDQRVKRLEQLLLPFKGL